SMPVASANPPSGTAPRKQAGRGEAAFFTSASSGAYRPPMTPRPRHRRVFLGLVLALAAGAITTALVAWVCVGLTGPQGTVMLTGNPVVNGATLTGGPN